MSDAPFTNYMYPDDNNIAESYWSRGYNPSTLIFNPWERTATANHKAVSTTTGNSAYAGFSGNPEFEGFIREGLRIRSRHNMAKAGVEVSYATVDFTDEQITSVQWHQYAYIIQPPTRYSWGSAVLFRNTGTGIGYLTIPLPNVKYNEEWPEDTGTIKADLKVTNVTPSRLIEGERRDVTITLNSGGSVATLNGEPAGITARRYWVDPGRHESAGGEEIQFTVRNVEAGSTILCRLRVFSQKLHDAGLPAEDETSISIYIGREGEVNVVTGVLAADARGSEKFDVLKGIPGTESLYANIIDAPKYLMDVEYRAVSGEVEYTVEVRRTYNLRWQVDNGYYRDVRDAEGNITGREWVSNWVTRTDSRTITRTYTIEHEYLYYLVFPEKQG